MKIDLHSHTHFSDGRLSPEDLIDRAIEFDVHVLAITDHDTTAGLASAHQYINQLPLLENNQKQIHLIDGIEISTVWQNKDIHIVGLGVDVENAILKALVADQKQRRFERAKLMASRLEKHTEAGVFEQVALIAGQASITRSHFAKWLVEKGYAKIWRKFSNGI